MNGATTPTAGPRSCRAERSFRRAESRRLHARPGTAGKLLCVPPIPDGAVAPIDGEQCQRTPARGWQPYCVITPSRLGGGVLGDAEELLAGSRVDGVGVADVTALPPPATTATVWTGGPALDLTYETARTLGWGTRNAPFESSSVASDESDTCPPSAQRGWRSGPGRSQTEHCRQHASALGGIPVRRARRSTTPPSSAQSTG